MSKNTSTSAKTSRVVQTPGSDPALNQDPAVDLSAANAGTSTSDDAFQAQSAIIGEDKPAENLPTTDNEALQKQVDKLTAIVQQLSAQRAPTNMPQKEELPTMAQVMKNPPTVPVLTVEGWFVPEKSAVTRA